MVIFPSVFCMFTRPGSSPSEILISPAMATRKENWGFFTIAVDFTKNQDLTGCTQRAQRVSSWGRFLRAIFLRASLKTTAHGEDQWGCFLNNTNN